MKISKLNNNYYKIINNTKEDFKSKNKSLKKQNIDTSISKDYQIRQKSIDKIKEIDKLERQAKIDRLKKEIKSGEYNINPEEIARIIVDIAMS